MSHPTPAEHGHAAAEHDAVESVVHLMPLVLPLAGGVLMLLLASIAVFSPELTGFRAFVRGLCGPR